MYQYRLKMLLSVNPTYGVLPYCIIILCIFCIAHFSVLLSPSGLSATLTGHTYTMADESVREIVEEWKLFYPKMFFPEFDSDLPVAVEVVIGEYDVFTVYYYHVLYFDI